MKQRRIRIIRVILMGLMAGTTCLAQKPDQKQDINKREMTAGDKRLKREFAERYAEKKTAGIYVADIERMWLTAIDNRGGVSLEEHETMMRMLEKAPPRSLLKPMRDLAVSFTDTLSLYWQCEQLSWMADRQRAYRASEEKNPVDPVQDRLTEIWKRMEQFWTQYQDLYNDPAPAEEKLSRASQLQGAIQRDLDQLHGTALGIRWLAVMPRESLQSFGQSIAFGVMIRNPNTIPDYKFQLLKRLNFDFVQETEINMTGILKEREKGGGGELDRGSMERRNGVIEQAGFPYGVEFGPVSGNDQAGVAALSAAQVQDNCRFAAQLAETLSRNQRLIFIEMFNEPEGFPPIEAARRGEAVTVLRPLFLEYMRQRYGDIHRLNEEMGTQFESFDDILGERDARKNIPESNEGMDALPPKKKKQKPPLSDIQEESRPAKPMKKKPPLPEEAGGKTQKQIQKASPEETILLNRFRTDRLADFCAQMVSAYRSVDTLHPVSSQLNGVGFDGAFHSSMVLRPKWDAIGMHFSGAGLCGPGSSLAFARSIGMWTSKPVWTDEFIYNAPEGIKRDDEKLLANVVRRNLWQHYSNRIRAFEFFEADGVFSNWKNFILDRRIGYEMPRLSGGMIPVMRDILDQVDRRIQYPLEYKPPIGVLYSADACVVGGVSSLSQSANALVQRCLENGDYQYAFLPIELLSQPSQVKLDSFKTMIAPALAWLSSGEEQALGQWVQRGGTLIVLGSFALYPAQSSGMGQLRQAVNAALNQESWKKDKRQPLMEAENLKFLKAFDLCETGKDTTVPDESSVFTTALGTGRLVTIAGSAAVLAGFGERVESGLGHRVVMSTNPRRIDVVVYQDSKENRYAFLVNRDVEHQVIATLDLEGDVIPRDLSLPECIIQSQQNHGRTTIPLVLGPGEGTVIQLSPNVTNQSSSAVR